MRIACAAKDVDFRDLAHINAWRMGIFMNPINQDNAPSNQKRLAYTRCEVAAMIGVTPITVDRLTKRGLLRPNRSTRRPLFALSEIERFLGA